MRPINRDQPPLFHIDFDTSKGAQLARYLPLFGRIAQKGGRRIIFSEAWNNYLPVCLPRAALCMDNLPSFRVLRV